MIGRTDEIKRGRSWELHTINERSINDLMTDG